MADPSSPDVPPAPDATGGALLYELLDHSDQKELARRWRKCPGWRPVLLPDPPAAAGSSREPEDVCGRRATAEQPEV